jgi:hypothetical protein
MKENKEISQTPEVSGEQKVEVKNYDYGHLVLFCGKCKSKYILEENVPNGQAVRIVLPPTNTAEMRLVCRDCGNEMALFYVESNKKKEENEVTKIDQSTDKDSQKGEANESISEESITEATIV